MDIDLFQRMMEALDEVVTLEDTQGRLVYVSPGLRRLLGGEPNELLGTPATALFHRDDGSRIQPSATQAGGPVQELRCRTREGSYRWVSMRSAPVRDARGQTFVVRRLRELHAEGPRDAETRANAIARLAGGIAHEFNNLLTVITGYSCVLLDGHSPGDAEHEPLSQILNASQRAAELVRQLLAVGGRQMLQPVVTDLNAIILGLTEVFKRILGPAIPLYLQLDRSIPAIKIDPTPLRRLLLDLAANARDAMPKGGSFTLTTANVPADQLPAGMPAGPAVRLTAQDTGRGMDEKTLQQLFEPFFTTKEVGQGTGLSLAAAYGTIRQCGGQLSVASQSGVGTTFTVILPHVPPET